MSNFNPYQPSSELLVDALHYENSEARLATRTERFCGAFIDGLTQFLIIVPLVFGLAIATGFPSDDTLFASILSEVIGVIIGASSFLVVNGYLLASQGRTIGKLVMKTRIVDRDTDQIVPLWPLIGKRYVLFWAMSILPVIGNWVSIIDALMIFRGSRACLHDDLANTKVIKD